MSFYNLKKIWNSEIYQGGNKKTNYFEGWYFKIVDKAALNAFSIIPSVSFGKSSSEAKACIQILDGKNQNSYNFDFNIEDFHFSKNAFEIKIEENYFSQNKLSININTNPIIKGELFFIDLTPWPATFCSPGVMGWYTFVPFMECYHGILSLTHKIQGFLEIEGTKIDFTEGKGYIEKDYGSSFPKSWVWIQCNHFKNNDTSLMCSIATIPFLKGSFTGFICGLYFNKDLYIFATYTGTKLVYIRTDGPTVSFCLRNKRQELQVEGETKNTGRLLSPKNGIMEGEVLESLTAEVSLKLYEITGETKILIYEDIGISTGMEIMWDSK
ncbi:MAG: hypothetical protein H7Y18_17240 [Clostridiaceae bacterium]|nr:hypothetical protein [Clostridiaceae bacterium]